MKKIHVLMVLLTIIIMSTCGCAIEDHVGTVDEKEREKILLWTYYETKEQKEAIEELADGFNESQDKYQLDWEYHGPLTDFNKRLAIGITQEQLPDIVIIDNPDMKRYAKQGVLEDVTPYISKLENLDTYYPNTLDSVCFNGRYYGVPFCCNNVALIYNEDLFKEKMCEVPETWDEFLDCAVALTSSHRKGFAMSAIEGEQSTFQILPYILSAGDDINHLGGDGTIAAFTLMKQLIDSGVMSKDCINWSQNDVAQKFVAGECAMMENGPWVLPLLENSGINYKIARLPYPTGSKSKWTGVTGGENIGVLKGKNLEGALEFIKYYNEESQMLKTNLRANSLPPRKDVARLMLAEKPEYNIFADQMETTISRSTCKNWIQVTEVLSKAQFSVIIGQMTPEEASTYIVEQGGDF